MNPSTLITHNGATVRLFKRSAAPGAAWYLHAERQGKRYLRSTGCAGERQARDKARLILDAIETGNTAAARLLLRRPEDVPASTVGEYLAWVESTPSPLASPSTRHRNCNCLRLILRSVHPGTDPDRHSLSALTPELIRGWFRSRAARAEKLAPIEAASTLRSSVSIANQAISLFSACNVSDARDAGLVVPDLAATVAEFKGRRRRLGAETVKAWQSPSLEVIDATLEVWRAAWGTDRNVATAIWLALSCGLRLSEIAKVCHEHLTPTGIRMEPDAIQQKSGALGLQVTAIEPYWSEGRAQIPPGHGALLTGSDTERRDDVFRRISSLMTGCGWQTQKMAHALRALSGSWVAMRYGIYAAQLFLRHQSVTTTERHYSHLVRAAAALDPASVPIRWATQTADMQPHPNHTNKVCSNA